jgi:hypothetical protein
MTDKEIRIPISKIKSHEADKILSEFSRESGFQVNELSHDDPGMEIGKDGKVIVKFPKFVQLIAAHDFDYILEKYGHEDVQISTDLLIDLANAPDEQDESRFSWLFMGLVIGVVVAAIIFLFVI